MQLSGSTHPFEERRLRSPELWGDPWRELLREEPRLEVFLFRVRASMPVYI